MVVRFNVEMRFRDMSQALLVVVFSRIFADDGEHSLAEANVYYTRLAEPIGQLWATNPRPPQGHTQCYRQLQQ